MLIFVLKYYGNFVELVLMALIVENQIYKRISVQMSFREGRE